MKRASSTTVDIRRNSKKTKYNNGSCIGTLVTELQTEIFARVAAHSSDDIINCKLSCKCFNEIAEDRYIYRHICLDKVPIVVWSASKSRQALLDKCRESENPELFYRQAVVDYFSKRRLESAYRHLHRAMTSGTLHYGSFYLTCIALLFSGDEESKETGIKLLANVRKSGMRRLRTCRHKLREHLRMMWVDNMNPRPRPVCCKSMVENHKKKVRWDVEEYEDSLKCEACIADLEIKYICGDYH